MDSTSFTHENDFARLNAERNLWTNTFTKVLDRSKGAIDANDVRNAINRADIAVDGFKAKLGDSK